MVVLESEIGTAIDLTSIQWHRHPVPAEDADCEGFKIYMGLSTSDELSSGSFDENYIAGTKTLVFSTDLLSIPNTVDWVDIELDTPFIYNGSNNLIIEISWDNGTETNEFNCHNWFAGNDRCIYKINDFGITPSQFMPQMILSGSPQALENSTFASIKVKLGF